MRVSTDSSLTVDSSTSSLPWIEVGAFQLSSAARKVMPREYAAEAAFLLIAALNYKTFLREHPDA
jgi:hypothetical protein